MNGREAADGDPETVQQGRRVGGPPEIHTSTGSTAFTVPWVNGSAG